MASKNISFGHMTKKQVAELFANIGLGSVAREDMFLAYMLGLINNQNLLDPNIYNEMARALRIPAQPEALEVAKNTPDNPNRQGNLVTLMAKSELTKIADVIQKGIESGKNPLDVKRELDMVKGLDRPRANRLIKYEDFLRAKGLKEDEIAKKTGRYFDKLLRDRKETIARTEMRFATGEGHFEDAKKNGKNWKAWMTVKDDRVSDLCASNEGAGWIKIDKAFPAGQTHVPGHPRCRCTIAYKAMEPDEWDIAYMQKRIEQTAKARAGEGEEKTKPPIIPPVVKPPVVKPPVVKPPVVKPPVTPPVPAKTEKAKDAADFLQKEDKLAKQFIAAEKKAEEIIKKATKVSDQASEEYKKKVGKEYWEMDSSEQAKHDKLRRDAFSVYEKQIDEANKKALEALNQHRNIQKDILYPEQGHDKNKFNYTKIPPDMRGDPKFENLFDTGKQTVSEMVNDRYTPPAGTSLGFSSDRSRGYYGDPSQRWPIPTICIGDKNTANLKTYAHEMGHFIENHSPDVKRKMFEFFNQRTQGGAILPMRPGSKEDYKVDKFPDNYCSRIYASGYNPVTGSIFGQTDTELLSMGMGYMYEDPVGFAKKDPEYFGIILDIMHGRDLW